VLRMVSQGYLVVASRPMRPLIGVVRARWDEHSADGEQRLPELTARESDILRSLARGHSIRQTARSLGIAAKTVENVQTRLFRKGPLASGFSDILAYIRTGAEPGVPDAELQIASFSIDMSSAGANAKPLTFESEPGVMFMGYPLRPSSQGRLMITSRDPKIPARIQPNYLSAEYDRQVAIGIFRYVRQYVQQPAMSIHVQGETFPGPSVTSDDEIVDFVRRSGQCGYHTVGTCSMGSDPRAALDSRLRVKGVTGLRVMDCSIMPTMVSGANTNGPVMALAWRAADLILQASVR